MATNLLNMANHNRPMDSSASACITLATACFPRRDHRFRSHGGTPAVTMANSGNWCRGWLPERADPMYFSLCNQSRKIIYIYIYFSYLYIYGVLKVYSTIWMKFLIANIFKNRIKPTSILVASFFSKTGVKMRLTAPSQTSSRRCWGLAKNASRLHL